jgi:hypothetical protein
MKRTSVPKVNQQAPSVELSSDDDDELEVEKKPTNKHLHSHRNSGQLMHSKFHGSKGALPSPLGSAHSFDMQVSFFWITFSVKIVSFLLIYPSPKFHYFVRRK